VTPAPRRLRGGLRISLHSDRNVTPLEPLRCVEDAVTRIMNEGRRCVLCRRARVGRSGAAGCRCRLAVPHGSLEPGKFADLLDRVGAFDTREEHTKDELNKAKYVRPLGPLYADLIMTELQELRVLYNRTSCRCRSFCVQRKAMQPEMEHRVSVVTLQHIARRPVSLLSHCAGELANHLASEFSRLSAMRGRDRGFPRHQHSQVSKLISEPH
jgi:hypothetical protein